MVNDELTAQLERMLHYITTTVVRSSESAIDVDTPLFTSGLVDSFGLVDVLLQLESVVGMRIPAGRLRPSDVDTVRLMVAAAHRVGRQTEKPR